MKKVLILGITGKMGQALAQIFSRDHTVIGASSTDFNGEIPHQVEALVTSVAPDILINAVARLGIDPCEADPAAAQRLNVLLPRQLARLADRLGFILIHLSTDAVFRDAPPGVRYTEEDCPHPLHLYGLTKLGGEMMVQNHCSRHYIFRLSLLFGPPGKVPQFVDRMVTMAGDGRATLRIATDVFTSPSFTLDLADKMHQMVVEETPWGLYHLVNEGTASLYELILEIVDRAELPVVVEPASHWDFPHAALKQTITPLRSSKIAPLRPWREAIRDYYSAPHHMSAGL